MSSKKKPNMQTVCFIDTEFNAMDYSGQNDEYQEITEIGAVVFHNGKPVDKFRRYCKLKKGHKATERMQDCCGITQDLLNKKGVPFNDAMNEFQEFLSKYSIGQIYAFGSADTVELLNTAKLNGADDKTFATIKRIKNVFQIFKSKLRLRYVYSLNDICSICNVEHGSDRAHDAANDAEDTGFAFYNMKAGRVNREILKKLQKHKDNIRDYRKYRKIKNANIKPTNVMSEKFIRRVERLFANAKGKVDEPALAALHDDFMRMAGRPDLEIGETNLS